jgi:hypothetical protein
VAAITVRLTAFAKATWVKKADARTEYADITDEEYADATYEEYVASGFSRTLVRSVRL